MRALETYNARIMPLSFFSFIIIYLFVFHAISIAILPRKLRPVYRPSGWSNWAALWQSVHIWTPCENVQWRPKVLPGLEGLGVRDICDITPSLACFCSLCYLLVPLQGSIGAVACRNLMLGSCRHLKVCPIVLWARNCARAVSPTSRVTGRYFWPSLYISTIMYLLYFSYISFS